MLPHLWYLVVFLQYDVVDGFSMTFNCNEFFNASNMFMYTTTTSANIYCIFQALRYCELNNDANFLTRSYFVDYNNKFMLLNIIVDISFFNLMLSSSIAFSKDNFLSLRYFEQNLSDMIRILSLFFIKNISFLIVLHFYLHFLNEKLLIYLSISSSSLRSSSIFFIFTFLLDEYIFIAKQWIRPIISENISFSTILLSSTSFKTTISQQKF